MIRITSQLAAELRRSASKATNRAYVDAEVAIKKHNAKASQRESWHVAQLCSSIRELAQDWRTAITAELPHLTVSMSSVFTHTKPYVMWPNRSTGNPRCELADLLVAVIDRRASPAKGVAILVQAKNSDNETVNLTSPSEKTQFQLLSQRPTFDVDKNQSPAQINLSGISPDSALLYGLATDHAHLHNSYCRCCHVNTWLTADALERLPKFPHISITASETLSAVLVGLLQGSYGWAFNLPPHGKDWKHFATPPQRHDWSMLINFLLEDTFKGDMSQRLAIPAGQIKRGQEEPLFLVAETPRNASMFLFTDGYNHLSQFASSSSESEDSPKWEAEAIAGWGDDGGANGRFNFNGDAPDNGPINALIIEIGTKG